MNIPRIALAAALLGFVGSVSAVTVTGTNFSFTFGGPLDTTAGQYGTVSANGNVVYLKPGGSPGFSTDAAGDISGPGSTNLGENKSFTLVATPGYAITGVSLKASGSYFFFEGSQASVGVGGSLQVSPLSTALSTPTFTANMFDTFDAKIWSAQTGTIALSVASPSAATVSIMMNLTANANGTTDELLYNYAFIDARELQLTVTTAMVPVPEPETYALLLAGLGAIGFVAARRRPRG